MKINKVVTLHDEQVFIVEMFKQSEPNEHIM